MENDIPRVILGTELLMVTENLNELEVKNNWWLDDEISSFEFFLEFYYSTSSHRVVLNAIFITNILFLTLSRKNCIPKNSCETEL